jgi:hypothetical protein
MKLTIRVVLFIIAVWSSGAAALRVVGQGATSREVSWLWSFIIALSWGAWYALGVL